MSDLDPAMTVDDFRRYEATVLADVCAIIGSLDVVFGEIDR